MQTAGMRELALFAGAGGGILAGKLLGWRTVCAVEKNPYAASVLLARQNDGLLPHFPIWDDVCTFDGRPWRGIVDVVSGGFPCQDISVAGKGAGIDGARSGLWGEMFRIVCEVRPRFVFVENSPALTGRGLGRVLGDLASVGFDAQWGVLGANDVGAPHKRERIWIVANARRRRRSEPGEWEVEQSRGAETFGAGAVSNAMREQPHGRRAWAEQDGSAEPANSSGLHDMADAQSIRSQRSDERGSGWEGNTAGLQPEPTGAGRSGRGQEVADTHSLQGMESQSQQSEHRRPAGLHGRARGFQPWPADPADAPESGVGRVVDGVAFRVDRIKALGNGQVPQCAAAAFKLLTGDEQ